MKYLPAVVPLRDPNNGCASCHVGTDNGFSGNRDFVSLGIMRKWISHDLHVSHRWGERDSDLVGGDKREVYALAQGASSATWIVRRQCEKLLLDCYSCTVGWFHSCDP